MGVGVPVEDSRGSRQEDPQSRRLGPFRLWLMGARPRTLVAAVVPVVVGASAVVSFGDGSVAHWWWRTALALVVALAMQVGVNYANDFSDGVHGTDQPGVRNGPVRLVGSKLVTPAVVKLAAFAAFSVAGLAGLVLAAIAGWWLVLVGAVCVAAAWGYTGGPRPYGYEGLGEVFVFIFFGLVATVGTAYVILESVDPLAVAVAVPVGLWAVALLMANNLRDIEGDEASGKRTLAVRFGFSSAKAMYVVILVSAYIVVAAVSLLSGRAAWGALAGLPLAVRAFIVLRRSDGPSDLVGLLAVTGRFQVVSGLGLAVGLALTG